MTLRGSLVRLAYANPEIRQHLIPLLQRGRPKQAGFFNVPLYNKFVTPKDIYDVMKRDGGFDMDYYDFSKVKFHPVVKSKTYPNSYEVIWLVFPHGEYNVKESDFVWGKVSTQIVSTSKNIRVFAAITVAI